MLDATAPRSPLTLHGWDAGITAALAPELRQPGTAHVAWSWRCPRCRAGSLAAAPAGALVCPACEERYPCPPDRAGEPRWPTERSAPRWEDDARLLADWDRYSAPGRLLARWGSSARREPCPEPRPDDEERHERRVLEREQRGDADDALDAQIQAYVDQGAALADAARAMEDDRQRLVVALKKAPKKKRGKASVDLLAVLLEHTAEAGAEAAPELGPRRDVSAATLGRSDARTTLGPDALPDWYLAARDACQAVAAALWGAAYLLITNAIKDRGIEWHGSLDRIAPRVARAEPFGSYRHALAAALSASSTLGGRARAPGGAVAKHSLPQGLVFGVAACHPSRSGTMAVAGEDEVIAHLDVAGALGATGRGRGAEDELEDRERTEAALVADRRKRQGLHGLAPELAPPPADAEVSARRRARELALTVPPAQRQAVFNRALAALHSGSAPSQARELDALDWELLRLVDRGRLNARARRDKQGRLTEAVEPLSVPEALADMRRREVPGAAQLTPRQAKIRLARARRAVQVALRATGQIPAARKRPRPTTPTPNEAA